MDFGGLSPSDRYQPLYATYFPPTASSSLTLTDELLASEVGLSRSGVLGLLGGWMTWASMTLLGKGRRDKLEWDFRVLRRGVSGFAASSWRHNFQCH